MSKLYTFTASTIIEADNEEEAKQKFADNSFDFASEAEITDVKEEDFLSRF